MSLRVAMVAGEPSGDLLAARVMQGIQQARPDVSYQGVGGPAMAAAGLSAWHPMDALSVFGYVDALKRLPGLVATYLDVKRRCLSNRPDVFVGIDAPDFNLRLEQQLKPAGIPTVHFVSPSIWAWRYERIHKIREAVSHMLVMFPFEEEIYRKEGIPVTYVGHPLARVIPMQPDAAAARDRLGVPREARVLALLPGSRASEIRLLGPRFFPAVQQLLRQDPQLQILIPVVNPQRRLDVEALLARWPLANCRIIDPDALAGTTSPGWSVLEAADAVLVASGTATLEAALFKKPMVISYVLSPAMRRIITWKSGQTRPYVPWVGLPNVLARDFVVPELLQDDATPDALAAATWRALTDEAHAKDVSQRFTAMHESLLRDTPGLAAKAILDEVRHAA